MSISFIDTIKAAIESITNNRRSLEDWCEIASGPVDAALAKSISEGELQFAGGYLCFSFADASKYKVRIAYELYFLDTQEQWVKQEAHSDAYASAFTDEALEEIASNGVVKFHVEE